MGNCLVLQEKVVRVMKTDGKILEYKFPIRVHQVLSEFTDKHAISDQLPVIKYLNPHTEMLQGHLYYLLPLPVLPPPVKKTMKKKKAVRFSDDVIKVGHDDVIKVADDQAKGVVRIKLVITKKELQEILSKEGCSMDDLISMAKKEESMDKAQSQGRDDAMMSKGWSPALESIPEIS